MASNLKFSAALKNAMQNAITAQAGASAILSIYAGTQPANPDAAIGGATELATLTCNATFAAAAAAGVLTMNAITAGVGLAAAGAGTPATWFRIWQAGKTVGVLDGTCGVTAGYDMNFVGSATIATGQAVSDTSFTLTNNN